MTKVTYCTEEPLSYFHCLLLGGGQGLPLKRLLPSLKHCSPSLKFAKKQKENNRNNSLLSPLPPKITSSRNPDVPSLETYLYMS